MAICRFHLTEGVISVGQEYGVRVLPNNWEAMLEVTDITSTGDGDNYKIVGYTSIDSEHYGPYEGGGAVLWTNSGDFGKGAFSDIPANIILSGYIKDSEEEGIEGITVSDGTNSDETSSSGYWWFLGATSYTGTITPTGDYSFDPEDISLTNRYWNVSNNNFVATYVPPVPGKPINPIPSNEDTDIKLSWPTLVWESGGNTDTFTVYTGLESDSLNEFQSGLDVLEIDMPIEGLLDYYTKYYWRVDATNEYDTTIGDEWYFTSVAFNPPLPFGITMDYSEDPEGEPVGNASGGDSMITLRRLITALNNCIYLEEI